MYKEISLPFFLLFIISEALLALLFLLTAFFYDKKVSIDLRSIIKGIVERTFLTICLVNQYPHALTLFSALKLGTRLKRDDSDKTDSKQFNDYYLVGNMVSVAAAIFYTKHWPAGI